MAHVALVCNLIRPDMLENGPADRVAEFDSEETLSALEAALRDGGHRVTRMEADVDLYDRLRGERPEMVFNIAEGLDGESRESLIPAVCELLGVPYTGSGVLTTALCLDKARTKDVLVRHGIRTPEWQLVESVAAPLPSNLRFPLIVKPVHEGSSIGMSLSSIVDDELSLRERVGHVLREYAQPALVERFVEGREFTVGVLGNDVLEVLPIAEVIFDKPRGLNLFDPDDPVIAMASSVGVVMPRPAVSHVSRCPAEVEGELGDRIRDTARRAYRAMGCRDWCRIDMRVGSDGMPQVIDVNPIAGLDPSYLLPRAANAAGYSYAQLINRILDHALERTARTRVGAVRVT